MQEKAGREALIADLCHDWKKSGIKLWLTRELLHIRAQYCCGPVDIVPLKVSGKDKASILAYAIGLQEKPERLIVVCPRYAGHLTKPDAIIPSVEAQVNVKDYASFHDLLADKPLMIQNIMDLRSQFTSFPIAVVKANFARPEQIKKRRLPWTILRRGTECRLKNLFQNKTNARSPSAFRNHPPRMFMLGALTAGISAPFR